MGGRRPGRALRLCVALHHRLYSNIRPVRLYHWWCMQVVDLIRLRVSRGFSIHSIGPNEARVLFDGAAAFVSGGLALAFSRAYTPTSVSRRDLLLPIALPALLIAFNVLLGIYTRLRLAFARTKALTLCASVLLSAVTAGLALGNWSLIVLWAMLVTTPSVLHPDSPLLHSVPSIQFFFGLIVLACGVAALQVTRWWHTRLPRKPAGMSARST